MRKLICVCGAPMNIGALSSCRSCYDNRYYKEKPCTACGEVLPRVSFYLRSNGHVVPACKECSRAKAKSGREKYPERTKRIKRRHRVKNAPAIAAYTEKYRSENKGRIYAQIKTRMAVDVGFRIARALRKDIPTRLKKHLVGKADSTFSLVGCTMLELVSHVERQWVAGMSWVNWGRGKGKWHIDHKKPLAAFDLRVEKQQHECFHYTNLQPLWQEENIRKGDRFTEGMCGV